MSVQAKKHLGQHFLKDPNIAGTIVDALGRRADYKTIIEVGPGMGILSEFLFKIQGKDIFLIELDTESVQFLQKRFPDKHDKIIEADFLRLDLTTITKDQFAIIGNFPYNISTQILFSVLDHRVQIPEVVGMFQKEVAERIASGPGNRDYGILSVLMQAYYEVELLFTLNQEDFNPPPKVKSAILHFQRKENFTLGCDAVLFKRVVKAAFNQRRKTLRNALSVLNGKEALLHVPFLDLRAEQLSWQQFVELTNNIAAYEQNNKK
ncbi:MAG TPA: 16S rRNA (adenine(1518)-N(6)/adenine(1519)-N(6))-dimethyltransferase RsmA [Bacteroidia bacterium]|nr:16S rRNA (adenine(1518)-N(6)/adenine(1519)-N(6))-dimethyltransferase RsmA [Bacteroidia bacterium]